MAFYDLFSSKEKLKFNPVGQWDQYEIKNDQKYNQGFLKLNGITINEFSLRRLKCDASLAKSKFNDYSKYTYLGGRRWYDFGMYSSGSICLQDNHEKAYFREIFIRELC